MNISKTIDDIIKLIEIKQPEDFLRADIRKIIIDIYLKGQEKGYDVGVKNSIEALEKMQKK